MKHRKKKTRGGTTDSPRFKRISMAISITVAALVTYAGCGGSDPDGVRVSVRGEVKLDGRPLQAGAIVFHCGDGENEVTSVGYIEDGSYDIASDEGPLAGTARVEFQAKPVDQGQFEEAMEEAAKTRRRPNLAVVAIPPHYGPNSNLTRELTVDGENTLDFDLTSRP